MDFFEEDELHLSNNSNPKKSIPIDNPIAYSTYFSNEYSPEKSINNLEEAKLWTRYLNEK